MIPLQSWGYKYLDKSEDDKNCDDEKKETNWKKVCAQSKATKTRDQQKSFHLCGRYKRVVWPKEHKFWLILAAVKSNIASSLAVSHWAIAYINCLKKMANVLVPFIDLAGFWLIPWNSTKLRNFHLLFSLWIIGFPVLRYMYIIVRINFLIESNKVKNSKKDEYAIEGPIFSYKMTGTK